ncbi:MAG: nucleotide sugar dehydrogenase [Thermoplasmata archaeon]
MDVCVIGLGYVGLPTAATLASHGHKVLGVDIRESVLDQIRRRGGPSDEPELSRLVGEVLSDGSLGLAIAPEVSDAFVLCLPTPIKEDKTADLSFVRDGMSSIIPFLKKGDLVILESTVPPGTTEGLLAEMVRDKGFDPLEDVDLVFAPERVMPGSILKELEGLDRVIGGLTPKAAERGRDLYASFVKGEIVLTDATTAEFVKLVENSYRDVNIAFANELAILAEKMNVNVWDAIAIANRHPRVTIHHPGPGVGGHCIAVDPYFLIEKAEGEARMLAQARQVNDSMPDRVVKRVEDLLGALEGRRVAILGVAYKGDVADPRESPALSIIELLAERGAAWKAHDPHVIDSPVPLLSLEEALAGAEIVILVTNHSAFIQLDPRAVGEKVASKVILDTRHVLDRTEWEEAGWRVLHVGDGKRLAK